LRDGVKVKDLPFADKIRWALEQAVRLTERAQDPDTGGWFYLPTSHSHEGSMTVTQITALRAAMEAGVAVNGKVMKEAYKYIRDSQNTSHRDFYGGFAYTKTEKQRVSVALTAASLTTFFGLGRYGDQPGDRKIIEDAFG